MIITEDFEITEKTFKPLKNYDFKGLCFGKKGIKILFYDRVKKIDDEIGFNVETEDRIKTITEAVHIWESLESQESVEN